MNVDSLVHHGLAVSQMPFEIVEIKGRGHPDTVCDLICEHVSADLLRFYQTECGRPLHYNVDKALLAGGKAQPRFGGGEIIEPAKLYLGDRATDSFEGRHLNLLPTIRDSVESWLVENLRFLRLNQNLNFISEIRPSSATLSSVEESHVSNDTSVGVGSWPQTPVEIAIVAIERHLNSKEFKSRHPETGEDIKIMAVRERDTVRFVCAIAMVDRFISSVGDYAEKKVTVKRDLDSFIESLQLNFSYSVEINCLDNPERGVDGLHLTVTGLSSENGDSGQVGRGNRIGGTISFLRPQTMEAWAGKNPVTHIGKIYSSAAQQLARRICAAIPEVSQADVFLVGQIGSPVVRPSSVFCNALALNQDMEKTLKQKIDSVIMREIESEEIFETQNVMRF